MKPAIPSRTNHRTNLALVVVGTLAAAGLTTRADDPRTNSWFTAHSARYARIYTSDANKALKAAVTTWTNGATAQPLPAYCGVQEVYSSSNWVYLRTTGLAGYVMGPWYVNAAHTQPFPDWPVNQKTLFRIPRHPTAATNPPITGGGAVGYFVDGVALFNSWDGNYWNGSTDVGGAGGDWNRDAYVNEHVSFDAGHAHQANGQYHYHADPIGLRYLLGDHVEYDPVSQTYFESTNSPTRHSPILGWVGDGYPVYGPYGYSNPTNPASGIRRMVSGYVPRDGQHGTDNLSTNGALRATIPAWAQRLFGASGDQSGPAVSTAYPFGRYMEDNAYLGDLTNPATGAKYQLGADFDLDEHNGRWCLTPEFPNGTYAYFTAIDSNGAPVFPYEIGRGLYGNLTGGTVSAISEPVVTNFLGGPVLAPSLQNPLVATETVTLAWDATEGATYRVDSSAGLTAWATGTNSVAAVFDAASYTDTLANDHRFYRVVRTALAAYDSAGTTIFSTAAVAPGGSATRGSTVTITITLPDTPPWPPAGATITSVTLGGNLTASGAADSTQGTVVATFAIPADAATGAQDIVVTFNPGPTYTLTGSFTIE
jgi:YHYH protein